MIIKRGIHNGGPSEDDVDLEYDGAESQGDHGLAEPPPSYQASSTPHSSVSDTDIKSKQHPASSSLSLGESPAQVPFDDLIGESSSRPARRSLPSVPPKPVAPTHEEQMPGPSHVPLQPPVTSREAPQLLEHPSRPRLPHAAQSAPDPRGKAKVEHSRERDPFGTTFYDEGPFAAARRAQRVESETKNEPDNRVYSNGRMPSFKVGEIVPVNTMGSAIGTPPFFPPHQAPSFPPTPINHHSPIRPAHFPAQLRPTPPPEPHPQPSRMPSQRHSPPAHAPQPVRSHSTRQMSAAPPHPQPPPQPHPHQQTSEQGAPFSPGRPSPAPSPSMPLELTMPPQTRRHTYDARAGVPPGLAPDGRLGSYSRGVVRPPMPPPPQGYPQPHPHAYPPGQSPGPPPQPPYQNAQPGRSILRPPPPHRHSVQVTARSPVAPPPPMPVRLPSQNVPTPSPHALGIVHAPPAPSSSPRPDPSRPPRATPKPVMPQLLEPLTAQGNNYGRSAPPQLQRSVSTLASEKGGLFSKTRSILRKRSSTSGIKTHADGAITFAPQPHSSKGYESHGIGLASVKEESGGVMTGKIGKRLSKKK